MIFEKKLIPGRLVRRYKRFLADVALDAGSDVTAHCPNSGSMTQCAVPGMPVMLSESDNPRRKLKYTLEMVHNGTCWIGVNTHLANQLGAEAIADGVIPDLRGYTRLQREKKYGRNSRIDILLSGDGRADCYVEIKNVTLVGDDSRYCFPDAVTARGLKHLSELQSMVEQGCRAVMLYVIQRSDGDGFRPAHEIDPDYARALRDAAAAGVELLAYRADVRPAGIALSNRVPVLLDS